MSSTDLPTLSEIRAALVEAGADRELLRLVDSSRDAEEAVDRLSEAGVVFSAEESVEEMLDDFAQLLEPGITPLGVELFGSEFFAALANGVAEDDFPAALASLIEGVEVVGDERALAMLRVLAALAPPGGARAAAEAADRLVAAGVRNPSWAKEVGKPAVGTCFGYADPVGAQEGIAITFAYGRKSHAVVVLIDHSLGGGVKDCFVSDRPDLIQAGYREAAEQLGTAYVEYSPDEARARLERALGNDVCAEHPDQREDVHLSMALLCQRVSLLSGSAAVPAATVHRLKITLGGSKPPIWRRLEVPSTITLQHLHQAIQEAFAWEDYHLWVFSTPVGEYGPRSDRELGHRSAATKKLSEVTPEVKARLLYLYDFGDNWEHRIVVEDVLDAEPGVAYPRCLTGKRAAPPEDCGGVHGYEHLCEVVANPADPEHADMLQWLGLDSAEGFDPAAFDLAAVDERLAKRAKVLVKA
ncbi:plasmid pRiA4b ORF-3 family protein [Saccharothrix coeruleofusca]|uniref:plasmid pRiA4b ORF-3 family protein n=1 Tax=Saccharothrix coeruleofusca TaxID=33919 RepID=UPI001E2BF3B5|nr:plasmid pRiA4b ORF-3 family protein [Saccharothrix coeruleofusca]